MVVLIEELNGYVEATKVDSEVNKLLTKHSPSSQNWREWLKFTRTVRTTCEIIELMCKEKLP